LELLYDRIERGGGGEAIRRRDLKMMAVIAWFDLHSPAMTAIAALGAMVSSIGSWICTVWGDRRAAKRSKNNADKIDKIGTLIEGK
jgi:hypothetical protein